MPRPSLPNPPTNPPSDELRAVPPRSAAAHQPTDPLDTPRGIALGFLVAGALWVVIFVVAALVVAQLARGAG